MNEGKKRGENRLKAQRPWAGEQGAPTDLVQSGRERVRNRSKNHEKQHRRGSARWSIEKTDRVAKKGGRSAIDGNTHVRKTKRNLRRPTEDLTARGGSVLIRGEVKIRADCVEEEGQSKTSSWEKTIHENKGRWRIGKMGWLIEEDCTLTLR